MPVALSVCLVAVVSACGGTMNWTSASGAGDGSCPAPLPTALEIDVQRQ